MDEVARYSGVGEVAGALGASLQRGIRECGVSRASDCRVRQHRGHVCGDPQLHDRERTARNNDPNPDKFDGCVPALCESFGVIRY